PYSDRDRAIHAVVTPSWREATGFSSPRYDTRDDYQAWLDGETYLLTLQRPVTWTSDRGDIKVEWENDPDGPTALVYGAEGVEEARLGDFPDCEVFWPKEFGGND